jgi:hypothetical protein
MTARPFHELMTELLRQFGLPLPSAQAQEIYTLHFDDQPDVHFVGKVGSRHVDVMTEAAYLSAPATTEALQALLELNACGVSDYPVTVTLHRATGAVIVWSRQPRAALDAGELRRVLQDVQKQAAAVRQRLEQGRERPVSQSGKTLARVARFAR